MTPYYSDSWLTVYAGDCRAVMAEMEPESAHSVVTSPPFWGLRDYGVDGQLGLEPTPEQYVENMVAVFREVRRVLRADGTVWLNLGDSYASGGDRGAAGRGATSSLGADRFGDRFDPSKQSIMRSQARAGSVLGLKPKDLVGIPWRVAFALQADGWYLRSDIIWSKPNPMPESVTDRPTKSHEYVFLLSKSARYYFDADAVREAALPSSIARYAYADEGTTRINKGGAYREKWDQRDKHIGVPTVPDNPTGRNIRSVWTIATQPYPGAHFATFPEGLVEPCVKAGTSEKGVCPECGAPWVRVREFTGEIYMTPDLYGRPRTRVVTEDDYKIDGDSKRRKSTASGEPNGLGTRVHRTTGWQPSCAHVTPLRPAPAVIFDPFAGSGTTARVAQRLGRRAVLIDLNPDYLLQAMERNRDIPLGLGA